MDAYYRLTKPGIVYGNAMTALATFVFASQRHADAPLLLATLAGLSLSIAAACVINNVIDRDIDARMERTKDRAIPTGKISVRAALMFAALLGASGSAILFFFTNPLTLGIALFGVFVYVCLYTPAKRRTPHSTLIGAVAGAVPPVVGYVAVTNAFDTTAFLLFVILACWQMTHFFAIAIFRAGDYRAANLPVMPVYTTLFRTKVLMLAYALLFSYAAFALYLVKHLGIFYSIPMALLSAGWIFLALCGFKAKDDARWARRLFLYSLIVLVAFSLTLACS